jgi:hypothetical protein
VRNNTFQASFANGTDYVSFTGADGQVRRHERPQPPSAMRP